MNDKIKIGLGVTMLAIGSWQIVAYLWPSRPARGRAPQPAMFYDIATGKLFEVERQRGMPIDSADLSPTAFRAVVYACGSCDDEASQFVGWIEKRDDTPMSDDEAAEMEEMGQRGLGRRFRTLVATVPKSQDVNDVVWNRRDDQAGTDLMNTATRDQCPAGETTPRCSAGAWR